MHELGDYICFPYSSILSSLSFIRFYFVLKLFKHLTRWTSSNAENTCIKYVCKADTKFAFKAFQKENPFVILGVIFIFTCVCGGLSLRNFELFYWETKKDFSYMDWDYTLNSMWCIFVSMCAVGYGDFYAKTQIGRFITILACLIGLYFSSMMMVFMTQKSALNENERKAYNLLIRLKLRNEIKEKNAHIVYQALVMVRLKIKKTKNDPTLTEKVFHIKFSTEKRKVINYIESIKEKEKMIVTFCSISFKDKILNISNRIEDNITEMKEEIDSLKTLGEILVLFADCQVEIAKYLKKTYFATNHLYSIIEKKKIFKKLNNLNLSLRGSLHLDKMGKEFKDPREDESENNLEQITPDRNRDRRSSYTFMEKMNLNYSDNDSEFEDNIFNYNPKLPQVEEYFKFISNSNQGKRKTILKSMKTLDFMKKKKTVNNRKLIKINNLMEKRRSNNELIKEYKIERKKTLLK
jgi:hypothetical protein